jgi:uncharacterized membrane protein YgdD (TMEM256/DUF423 family)
VQFMAWTTWITIGSFSGAISVLLGAFGAHAMKGKFSDEYLGVFETGVRYQFIHALAILAVAMVAARIDGVYIRWAGYLFLTGSVIFSGSLYALVLTGQRWLGMITPVGGIALVAGWILLGISTMTSGRV